MTVKQVSPEKLRRPAPHRSLPPCGGGTGRGAAAHAESVTTPLPTSPPQGGRGPAVPVATGLPSRGARNERARAQRCARGIIAASLAVLAAGCSSLDRLRFIGEQPPLAQISNPQTQPGYKPVQ